MRLAIEEEFTQRNDGRLRLPADEIARIHAYFAPPDLSARSSAAYQARMARDPAFAAFIETNVAQHKTAGHGVVTISLKPIAGIPGDATAEQMEAIAALAERYSHDEIRVSHEQNLVLPHVALDDVPAVFDELARHGLATANAGRISDIIACPGLDYCSLATARSIPVAQRISERFGDGQRARDIGDIKIKISGCINACGHHHVGNIGILGLERKGVETYQITLGGSADETCAVGDITGPGFSYEAVVDAVETVVDTYLGLRTSPGETFLDAYRRVGMAPFKAALYEKNTGADI
jgi:sulfite reductase (NADPH) hemoprotein beta-component